MSDYTSQSFAEACLERLRAVDPSIEASIIPRLRIMLPVALESLAQKVGSSPDRNFRNLLRKALGTMPVASGVGLFTALSTYSTTPILLDQIAIRSADIRTSSGQKIQMLADRASLDQDRPDSFLYGACEGVVLFTDAPDGPLTVFANYIETNVALLPTQLVPMLFEEMLSAWGMKAAA